MEWLMTSLPPWLVVILAAAVTYLVLLGVRAIRIATLLALPRQGNEHKADNAAPVYPAMTDIPHDMTRKELLRYNGEDQNLPLLMSIEGQIFDIGPGSDFYAPGGPYAVLAGREAAIPLAKMSFDDEAMEGVLRSQGGDVVLSAGEDEILQNWKGRFSEKYTLVGNLLKD